MVAENEILNAHILVVDDVEDNVALLEHLLHSAGYTSVSSTRDPHEVCELQRRHRFSLILLDLQMPGMDGFQVMDQLKQLDAGDYAPVLVITAQPMHKLRALRDGAKDFISKPFDPRELLIRIHNMLEVRLLHEAARDHGKTLESLALTDPLTGLANRRLLVDRLSMGMVQARREQRADGAALSRPRRVQGRQQHARARGRRRAAEDGRRAAAGHGPRTGHRRAARRRRVRDRARPGRRRRGRPGRRKGDRVGVAAVSRSRASRRASPSASASACIRSMATTPRR